jgi:RimJ/RimL family protein N-acetyltransferase
MESVPAYRIETERLVLRCYDLADGPAVDATIADNIAHLRRWMSWAHAEPLSPEARLAQLRRMRSAFDRDLEHVYGIFDRAGKMLGGTGLHPRVGEGGIEIGYWIDRRHEGRGLVTEAAGALTRLAIEILRLDRVEIHCDPENTRSAAVPRRLGYTHEATLRRRVRTPDGGLRDSMIWSLFADDLTVSPAGRVAYTAHDAIGRPLGRPSATP